MTSQEDDIVVQRGQEAMGDLIDKFDENDPKNQSFLAMVEGKNGDTLAFLAMSDTENEPEEESSKEPFCPYGLV